MTKDDFKVYFDSDTDKWVVDRWIPSEWSPNAWEVEGPYWFWCGEFCTESAANEWIKLEKLREATNEN